MGKFYFVLGWFLLSAYAESPIKSDQDFPRISAEERGRFYSLLQQVDQIFNQNQIPYWGISGTLLGAARHQGMIPWDDDIDLIILYQNRMQLEMLEPILRKRNLEIVNYGNCVYKIFPSNGKPILNGNGNPLGWKYPFIDVFLVNKVAGAFRIVSIANPTKDIYQEESGKKGWFLLFEELFFPIERVPFGPVQLPIPNHFLQILKREYGEDCMEVAYLQYSHAEEKFLKSGKVPITDFSPPKYELPKNQ